LSDQSAQSAEPVNLSKFGRTENPFCNVPHPDPKYTVTREVDMLGWVYETQVPHPTVFCRLFRGHPGDHAAYTFSIQKPEMWPDGTERAEYIDVGYSDKAADALLRHNGDTNAARADIAALPDAEDQLGWFDHVTGDGCDG
jgi:hypothetical protein